MNRADRRKSGIILADARPKARFQIRIMADDPQTEDTTEYYAPWTDVLQRAYVLARRTSYAVNGRNREVRVSIERWSNKDHTWKSVFQAKTRLREGAGPV
jgi:hypothetical protein